MIGALPVFGVLAAWSVLASEMPRAWAWSAAVAALAYAGWLARREARQPAEDWFWPGTDQPATVDGDVARDVVVAWRGPLAFVRWRDAQGRVRRRSWWPDMLPPARRRELRLAATAAQASPGAASMAP